MENKELSIRKAAIIGLITGCALLIIGFVLGFIFDELSHELSPSAANIAVMKVFVGILWSFVGGWLSITWFFIDDINNAGFVLLLGLGGQVLLGVLSGILLALISKKSRQLKTIWFGVRVAEVLMIVGIIITLIFKPKM